jgi:hypothetical protein
VLGLREGATENAAVVSELLGDLAGRGLDFSVPRLYVLDGGKALPAAGRRYAGEAAMIQRCQVHKRRNVIDHLPDEPKSAIKKKLQNACAMAEYSDAKRALERLHRELMGLNPSAARILEEGMEETLNRASLARTRAVAPYPGEHQRDRVGFLHRRNGLPQRETLARRRPHRTLGGLGPARGRARVPQGAGLPRDSIAVDRAGQHGFEEGCCCRGSEGCVTYDSRESLTFNRLPGNLIVTLGGMSFRSLSFSQCRYLAHSISNALFILATMWKRSRMCSAWEHFWRITSQ